MIAFVSGILEMKLNGYIVIDVGGVGYKVFMSEGSIDLLGVVKENIPTAEADEIKAKLEEAGATVEVK